MTAYDVCHVAKAIVVGARLTMILYPAVEGGS